MEETEAILRAAEARVEEAEVYAASGITVEVGLRGREIYRAVETRSEGIGIRVIDHGRIGSSATSDPSRWETCLDAAVAASRLATPQPWEGLPDPAPLDPDILSYDPALAAPSIPVVTGLVAGMLEGAGTHPATVTAGSAAVSMTAISLATSTGIRYESRRTYVGASLEAISGTSTGYESAQSTTLDIDPLAVGERASFLAVNSVGGQEIRTGTYPVLLSPHAAAQLLGSVLVPALSGRNVHAGRSALAGRVGEVIGSPSLTLKDLPHIPRGPASTTWDAEGTSTREVRFISRGRLEEFAYDLRTAARYGAEATGSAVRGGHGGSPVIGHHNLHIGGDRVSDPGGETLYVHDVVGAHTANPVSGDFSVEIQNPCWCEGVGPGSPVRKAMLSGNIFELLNSVVGIAGEERAIGAMIVPSILLRDQHIIGE